MATEFVQVTLEGEEQQWDVPQATFKQGPAAIKRYIERERQLLGEKAERLSKEESDSDVALGALVAFGNRLESSEAAVKDLVRLVNLQAIALEDARAEIRSLKVDVSQGESLLSQAHEATRELQIAGVNSAAQAEGLRRATENAMALEAALLGTSDKAQAGLAQAAEAANAGVATKVKLAGESVLKAEAAARDAAAIAKEARAAAEEALNLADAASKAGGVKSNRDAVNVAVDQVFQTLFGDKGLAPLRSVLGLNLATLDAARRAVEASVQFSELDPATADQQLASLEALRQMIIRVQQLDAFPGVSPSTGDPLVPNVGGQQ